MDKRAADRKGAVQALRRCAVACGVTRCRDDAARPKVQQMMEAIRGATGPPDRQAEAETWFKAYDATFIEGDAAAPQAAAEPQRDVRETAPFRMRGSSFLLTYNWKFYELPLPDGTATSGSEEELWRLWRRWKQGKKKELGITQSSSTLEQSLKSSHKGRVHFHWKVNLKQPLDQMTTDSFAFHGIRPDVRATVVPKAEGARKPRGANFLEASNRGHFYVVVDKVGTLKYDCNYKPWENYRVLGKWLDDLWTDGKISHNTYHDLALRVRVGFSGRKRDLDQVLAAEADRRVDEQIEAVGEELEQIKAPFLTFPAVQEWEDSFLHLDFRWKLLALVADSASGKSSFAESLFSMPFVITVEDAEHLDLRSFDRNRHDGIVLDNVNSWGQLLSWRAMLQARNAKTRGGQSATNLYAYTQYLFGVAIVVTVDLDAPDAHLANPTHKERSKWLCKNCVFVRLPAGRAFYDKDRLPTQKPENAHSLFARTVKRRRASGAAT